MAYNTQSARCGRPCGTNRQVTMWGLDALVAAVEGSTLARTIGESSRIIGLLSGTHLIGLTVLVGGALTSGLRAAGIAFSDRPVGDVTAPIIRTMTVGLVVSVFTGALLVAPRLSSALANGFFQKKMLLLLCAVAVHFGVSARLGRAGLAGPLAVRVAGLVAFVLWLSVVLAGCAFILLE